MIIRSDLIQLVDVTKRYEGVAESASHEVLKGVSFSVAAGESVAIAGPSGSGKSTLLNLIGTLDSPTSGKVFFDGKDLTELREIDLAAFRNQEIGFVFQAHHLLPQCNVLENVLVPTLAGRGKGNRESAEARARRLLERVGLADRITHRPGQLSGGECQRVAVVRSLINEPRLLLADEPTGSLDRSMAEELGRLLVELNREEEVTLVVVTHSESLASRMGRTLRLSEGKARG
jgi:ABC-type lipoprotein export system ATPase subunit